MTGSEDEFKKRIAEKKWPVYKYTSNKSNTSTGDDIIFYVGGLRSSKYFAGTAVIASDLVQVDTLNYHLIMKDVSIWKKPVLVSKVVNDLKFVKNKDNWGAYMQSGILRVTDDDYGIITRCALDSNVKKVPNSS